MESKIEQQLAKLKEKGKRTSVARGAILQLLMENSTPLSAAEILAGLTRRSLGVNKTTVYRELELLCGEGVLRELEFGDRKKRYEMTSEGHHHHLVCTICRRVEDVELPRDLDLQERQIERQKKFKILNHTLEFFGICRDCKSGAKR
ncbi:MAG: transcriptional repressor [Patescibacteria group bacterium]